MDSSKHKELTPATLFFGICKAQGVFLLCGGIFLLIFCWIAYIVPDPDAVLMPLSLVALCLSALAGGIGAVRFTGDGLVSGLCSGVLSMLLIRCLSVIPLSGASQLSSGYTVLFYLLIPVLSVCGAVLGKKRKKQIRHKALSSVSRRYR